MTKLVRFDWAIKYLLRNKADFDVLEGFLSELLKIPIKIESFLESESNKNHAADKFNRVDLLDLMFDVVERQARRQSKIIKALTKNFPLFDRPHHDDQSLSSIALKARLDLLMC